MKCRQLVLLYF